MILRDDHRARKVTRIWDVERCNEPGCRRIACYRFFSQDNRNSYFACLAHANENHCPFPIHGLVTCLFRRKQIRDGRRYQSLQRRSKRRG